MLIQNIFRHDNLKDYQTKVLSIMALKQDYNLEEVV